MKRNDKLLWISRICLVAATLAIWFLSYFYTTPVFTAPFLHSNPHIALALYFGGTLTVIALFSWFWPGTGGILSILYSLLVIWQSTFVMHGSFMPFYLAIFALFLVGGIVSVAYRFRSAKPEMNENRFAEKAIKLARLCAVASIILWLIIYMFIYPMGLWFGAVFAIFITFAAWRWPASGGVLMVLVGLLVFPLADSNYDFRYKLPAYILLLIFVAGGVLNIVGAWKQGLLRYG